MCRDDQIFARISGYPTTCFVDSDGIAAFNVEEKSCNIHVLMAPEGFVQDEGEYKTLDTCSDGSILLEEAAGGELFFRNNAVLYDGENNVTGDCESCCLVTANAFDDRVSARSGTAFRGAINNMLMALPAKWMGVLGRDP